MRKLADIYDRLRKTSSRLLSPRSKGEYGLELVLRQRIVGEYNPDTGGQSETITEYNGSGLRTNYKEEDISDSYILQGDLRMLISPVALDGAIMPTPSTNDVIVFDGSEYSVISVGPWNYAGLDLGWACQCRGL